MITSAPIVTSSVVLSVLNDVEPTDRARWKICEVNMAAVRITAKNRAA